MKAPAPAPAAGHILLVDDEPGLRQTLSDRLRAEGYDVSTAHDGPAGERLARDGAFDMIILDLMLPSKNGFEVLRDLRRDGLSSPVLMLTSCGATADKVIGFKCGADDYVTKPFDSAELLVRIEALLRRARGAEWAVPEVLVFGDVHVRARAGAVVRRGQPIRMAAREFKLLCFLARHPGVVFSRDELLDAVWGPQATPESRTVDVHMGWLRQKLEDDPRRPRHFITVYGLGYRFDR